MKNKFAKKVTSRIAVGLTALAMIGTAVPASVAFAEENEPAAETPEREPVRYYPIQWIRIPINWEDLLNDTPETPLGSQNETTPENGSQNEESAAAQSSVDTQNEVASADTVEDTSASVAVDQMSALIKEIIAANAKAQNTGVEKMTVYHTDIASLTTSVMKTLKDCPNVNLDLTYSYEGVEYHVVIPGGSTVSFDENVSVYGPLWLFGNFGTVK